MRRAAGWAQVCRDLAALLRMGYAPVEAVQKVAERTGLPPLKEAGAELLRGATMGAALRRPGVPDLVGHGVAAGEAAGEPARALEEVSGLLEEAEWRRLTMLASLSYPCFLLVGLSVLMLVLGAAGRSMREVLGGMSLVLPLPTRLAMGLGDFMTTPLGLLALLLPPLLAVGLLTGKADGLRLRLPILGGWLRRHQAGLWLRWLSYLLGLGVPLPVALRGAAGACASRSLERGLQDAAGRVEAGSALTPAVERLLPPFGRWLVGRAEAREFAPGTLEAAARVLEREADLAFDRSQPFLELLALVLVALFLGLAIASFFLPLYQLIGNMA